MDIKANGGPVKNVLVDLQIVVEKHAEAFSTNEGFSLQVLLALTIAGRFLSLSSSIFTFFSLTAIQFYSLEIWRFATAPFMGRNILETGLTFACLHIGCKIVHQNNTIKQLFKHFAIVEAITFATVSICALFSYILFGHISLLYNEVMAGMLPIDVAILVLVKQFLPDSIVLTTPFGRLKYTHLPLTAVFLIFLAALVRLMEYVALWEAIIAMQVSWTYLRFMQPHPTDAIYGDTSEHFSWSSLFPSASRPFMAVIGKICYRLLLRVGLIRRQVRTVDVSRLTPVPGVLPSFEDPGRDAERRRKLALQALNERLAKMQHSSHWQDEDDEPSSTSMDAKQHSSPNDVSRLRKDFDNSESIA